MALKNSYLASVYENVCKRNPGETEFHQTVEEVLESLEPVAEKRPDLIEAGIFERMVEPERQIQFRAGLTTTARSRLTAAIAYSSTPQSVLTRAVCVSTPQLTLPS